MRILLCIAIILGFPAVSTGAFAQASCLNLDRSGAWAAMENTCSTGIDFQLTDEGSCAGWRCSGYVGPGGRYMLGSISGYARYYACYSPGGIGDVTARCSASGECYCWD